MAEEFVEGLMTNLEDTSNPIADVKIGYRNTGTRKKILNSLSQEIKEAKTISELLDRSLQVREKLKLFSCFKTIQLAYVPGKKQNHVKVLYNFKEASHHFASGTYFFDKDGQAMMTIKGGLRNYLGMMDNIFIQYDKSITNSNKNAYYIQLQLPYLFKLQRSAHIIYNIERRTWLENCEEHIKQFQIIYQFDEKNSLTLENSDRNLAWRTDRKDPVSKYYINNFDFLPTSKFSLKYMKEIKHTIQQFINVEEGTKSSVSGEITLPFSEVQFLKLQFNYKQCFSLLPLKKYLRRANGINLELSTSFGITRGLFGRQLQLNDCNHDYSLRGFHQVINLHRSQLEGKSDLLGDRKFSLLDNLDFYLKSSAMINLFQYPGVGRMGGQGFYHATVGYLYRSRQSPNQISSSRQSLLDNLRYSAGFGAKFGLGMGVKLELLYNLFVRGNPLDTPQNFQIRIAVDD